MALADLYSAETFTLTAEGDDMPPFDDELFVKAAEYIRTHGGYDASMLKTRPVRDLIDAIYGIFRQAIERGIGRKTPSIVTDTLGSNAFIFSGLKVNNSLMEVGLSLTDSDGHIKPFETFLNEVKGINNTYNHNYLRAEYNHAVASAQIAAKWYDFKEDGDEYDLQYRTSGDEKVRESHRLLDGITLAFDDPFWDRYMPPNGWNCRCTVVQVKKGKYRRDDSKKVMELGDAMTDSPKLKIFRFNPGKELSLFPKKHPYFKGNEEAMETLRLREMIEEMPDNLTQEEKEAIAKNNVEIEKALGIKKGRRMTVEEADKQSANPKYVPRYLRDKNGCRLNPKYKESDEQYNVNCATCAPAYAMRLRGFDFKAKGRIKKSGSLNDYIAASHSFDAWLNVDGSKAEPILTYNWMIKKGYKTMSPKRYREYFEETCNKTGVYVLTIGWKNGGGHATILQRFIDGTLRYIEPQSYNKNKGIKRSLDELCMKGTKKPHPLRGILRIDNKVFNNDFLPLFDK